MAISGNPQTSSVTGIFNNHSEMVELDMYINNVEKDERVMSPGHTTLLNTPYKHISSTCIKEYNYRVI